MLEKCTKKAFRLKLKLFGLNKSLVRKFKKKKENIKKKKTKRHKLSKLKVLCLFKLFLINCLKITIKRISF